MTSLNSLTIAGNFFVCLLVLEWLFWMSPLKHTSELLSNKMGAWFYVLQPHYIIRVLALCVIWVLWSSHLELWSVFTGGRNWFYSFSLGIILSVLSSLKVPHRTFWQEARHWYQEDRHSFARSILYLLVYPGLVEELLFRWFFTAILWARFGWWTVVIVPILNIIWHLPVWWDTFKGRKWQDIFVGIIPITTFAIALTAIAITTNNLIGPVIAHAFGDWCGLILQRDSFKATS